MKSYSPNWAGIIFLAVIFHAMAVFSLTVVLPQIFPDKILESEELTWLDVDLADNSQALEEESVPVIEEESAPEPEFQPFVMPELVIPETIFEPLPELPPPPPPPPPYVPKPIERPAPIEQPAPAPEPKVEKKAEPEKTEPPAEEEPQQMGEPPKTLKEVQPTENLGYKGFVTVRVRIGTDGSILYSDVMRSSKREEVDALALECAGKWQFEPALDQKGRPMACDKIITFDFKKIA